MAILLFLNAVCFWFIRNVSAPERSLLTRLCRTQQADIQSQTEATSFCLFKAIRSFRNYCHRCLRIPFPCSETTLPADNRLLNSSFSGSDAAGWRCGTNICFESENPESPNWYSPSEKKALGFLQTAPDSQMVESWTDPGHPAIKYLIDLF